MGIIYGKNPVYEAICAGNTINKIYAQTSNKEIDFVIKEALKRKIVVVNTDKQKLDNMIDGKNSQGVIASVTDFNYSSIEDIIEYAKSKNEDPFVVILDKIKDPHNLGAIIRSCECMGVHGIVIQKRNACQVNDTVEKVAAGACSYVKVARVTNITESIKKLKEYGLWIYGLDMDGSKELYNEKLSGPIGIVVGNEGEGISRLVKENCDVLIKIPMTGKISSLNASVSTAISIYEVKRQKNNI